LKAVDDPMTRTTRIPGWLRVLMLAGIPFAAAGMIALGFWQLSRLQERREQNALITQRLEMPPIELTGEPILNPDDMDYRPVIVQGVYDSAQEIVWKNRAHQGSPGAHVITPLRIAGADAAVLVDRGWIPYTQTAPDRRAVYQVPKGEVVVRGLLRQPDKRESSFLPADPTLSAGRPRLDDWFWLEVGQIQQQVPYPLLPLIVQQGPGPDPSQLPISGSDIELSEGPHLGYAIQWFSFAAIAIVGPVLYWYQARRRREAGK
jgi:surfeit locus 1 family protein